MKADVTVIECIQTNGVKPEITVCKLRSCVLWQRALKQKGAKQIGLKRMVTCIWH